MSRMTVLFSISVSNHAIFPNSLFCFAFRSIPHSSAPNDSCKSEFHISGRWSSVHSDLLSSFYLELQLRIPSFFTYLWWVDEDRVICCSLNCFLLFPLAFVNTGDEGDLTERRHIQTIPWSSID